MYIRQRLTFVSFFLFFTFLLWESGESDYSGKPDNSVKYGDSGKFCGTGDSAKPLFLIFLEPPLSAHVL